MITASEYLAARLVNNDVTHVFGVAGTHNTRLFDSALDVNIELITNCNELHAGN